MNDDMVKLFNPGMTISDDNFNNSMHNSKILRILRTFSAWDIYHLNDFIHSPFFNKNDQVLTLWQNIKGFAPDFDHSDLERLKVYGKIFPGESYQSAKFRHLQADMTRLLETFLVQKHREDQSEKIMLDLIRAYSVRGLEKDYEETCRKYLKKTAKKMQTGASDFLQNFEFEENRYLHAIQNRSRKQTSSVNEVMNALDRMYLARKLRYSCEVINRANILNQEYSLFLTGEITRKLQEFPHLNHPLIDLYRQTFMTLTDGEEEAHYYGLRNSLEGSFPLIDPSELNHLYAFALNYAIRQFNSGKREYGRQIFDLYKVLIEQQLIFEQGLLPVPHYKNMVAIGTRLKEYDWVGNFIETYQKFLPKEEAHNAYTYNQAYLLFARGEYRKVLKLLSSVEFTDIFYLTDARATLMRTYYELEDFDGLTYLMGSFRMLLRRDKQLSEYQRKLYLNLIKTTQLLMKYQLGEKITKEQIQAHMDKVPNIAAKGWVLEKLRELSGY